MPFFQDTQFSITSTVEAFSSMAHVSSVSLRTLLSGLGGSESEREEEAERGRKAQKPWPSRVISIGAVRPLRFARFRANSSFHPRQKKAFEEDFRGGAAVVQCHHHRFYCHLKNAISAYQIGKYWIPGKCIISWQ